MLVAPTQSSVPVPPALTRGQEARRIVSASVLGVILWAAQFGVESDPGPWAPLLDLALGVGALVALPQRRRWPFAVALTTVAASAWSGMAFPAAFIALVSLTTTRRRRQIALVVAVGTATAAGYEFFDASDDFPWWALTAMAAIVWGIAVLVGLYVATRRALAFSYRERAEQEQRARVEQARLGERTRIAREMHDVLAHRISLLALHAGAMTYRDDLSRDELRATARLLEDNARLAMEDLRSVLGLLRDPTAALGSGGPPERPQPTLVDLPELLAETRTAGHDVTLDDAGLIGARLPDTVSRTAYRVVQEGLTNVRKHAPGAAVQVRLARPSADRMTVAITNPITSPVAEPVGSTLPGAGVGLVGLGERTASLGGELRHGVGDDQTFRLRAELPLTPAVTA